VTGVRSLILLTCSLLLLLWAAFHNEPTRQAGFLLVWAGLGAQISCGSECFPLLLDGIRMSLPRTSLNRFLKRNGVLSRSSSTAFQASAGETSCSR
jgi:hypothetical protein